jgi:dipeptidyl aminopeptidase/acylaminoacyl peptidase
VVARGGHGLWDREALVEPELIDAVASDGAVLHARVFRARGGAVGPRPTLVSLHGGPTGQTAVDFVARHHWWVSRGWAVLVPDHRGTSGWGRDYWLAMDGRWGELDVSDSVTVIEHAIASGIADPSCVVVSGGSSGGYTALALMAARPDLVRAGIALYPVVDHVELAKRTHRFERHYNDRLIGPLPDALDTYVARSPITFADRLTQPLLMLHGAIDEVIPVSQPLRLHQRLVELGRPSTLHVYEGEGHGWSRPETTIDEMTRTEAFLVAHRLGRG